MQHLFSATLVTESNTMKRHLYASQIQFRPVVAALELTIQKDIEERCHFVVNLGIGWLWQAKKHLHKLRRHITGDNLAVPPVIVLRFAMLESQLDPLGFFVPAVDLERLGIFQRSRDIGQPAERIFGLLPEDQKIEIKALFDEYEACETAEAQFVRVMDNFQPLLLNHSNGGSDWKSHNVSKSQVVGRQQTSRFGSEEIWEYIKGVINDNVNKGNIRDE